MVQATCSVAERALKESMRETSSFLRMSAELCNHVYEYAAASSEHIVLIGCQVLQPDLALAKTCCQTMLDCLPVFGVYLRAQAGAISITVTDI